MNSQYFVNGSCRVSRSTRSDGGFYIRTYRLTLTNKIFLSLAPRSWDALPKVVRDEHDLVLFKMKLKENILSSRLNK